MANSSPSMSSRAPFILAPAKNAGSARRWRRCQRRQTTARQTTSIAAPATAAFRPASVIAVSGPDLAAKHPIGPGGIGEDQRDQHGDADQHEQLAVAWGGGLPDVDALRHDK